MTEPKGFLCPGGFSQVEHVMYAASIGVEIFDFQVDLEMEPPSKATHCKFLCCFETPALIAEQFYLLNINHAPSSREIVFCSNGDEYLTAILHDVVSSWVSLFFHVDLFLK